jgi:predicted amino acid dehydrogenase
MVQIYRKKWQKNFLASLLGYLRDSIILILPVKHIHPSLTRLLYGTDVHFAFLVHPRAYQDIFISSPFLKPLQFILRKKNAARFFFGAAPFVLNKVHSLQGVHGLVVALMTMPELMFGQRREAEKRLVAALKLISKIGGPGTVVGLGGWWPMVTQRGLSIKEHAEKLGLRVTNGHCGTLASIYLTIEKIARIGKIEKGSLCIAIIGVGKMGTNVARALNGRVKRLILIDIQEPNLKKIKRSLEEAGSGTVVDIVISNPESIGSLKEILKDCQIGVCATSSLRNLLKLRDLPYGFIAIDDSRPEALPRDPKNERIVLEGGLLKIIGAAIDYDFGFGQDDNVFGCLGEAFLLALDKERKLKPTLGDVDMENFFKVLDFCCAHGVTAGDLKSSDAFVSDAEIAEAFERRKYPLLEKSAHA